MSSRLASLVLSALAWVGFVVVMLWTMGFIAGVVVPRTVDGPVRTSTGLAVAADLGLLGLFALQHSVMARSEVKAWLRRWIPASLERTTFVLVTDVCLVVLLVLWQPWGGQVWDVNGSAAVVLWLLCAAGWLLAVTATFAVDHLELTGLRQAGWAPHRSSAPVTELQTGGLYAVVRHPLLTGMVLAFWATPQMSASHLLFALGATAYVAVGMRFEERDLRRSFGASYDAYAARVPALVPRLPIRAASSGRREPTCARCDPELVERRMPLSQLLRVLDVIESIGCPFWLEGGWGIDALVGQQTRDHRDVDIDFDATREKELIEAFEMLGYREILDERPTRIELVAADGRCVDLHPLHPSGDARQQAPDGSWWHFRREWFTTGSIESRPVPCYTTEGQRYFHSGYELRDVDVHDLATLDALAVEREVRDSGTEIELSRHLLLELPCE
jgi:protein-S-isoprenylcysteine O-methyltransferase Ste14